MQRTSSPAPRPASILGPGQHERSRSRRSRRPSPATTSTRRLSTRTTPSPKATRRTTPRRRRRRSCRHRLRRPQGRRSPGRRQSTPGSTITYQLTVQNVGTDPAFNVKVRDDLPAHTTFVSAVDTTDWPTAPSAARSSVDSILCTGGTLDGISRPDPVRHRTSPTPRTSWSRSSRRRTSSPFVTRSGRHRPDLQPRDRRPGQHRSPESNETNNASQHVDDDGAVGDQPQAREAGAGVGHARTRPRRTRSPSRTRTRSAGATAFGVKIVDPLPAA